LFIHEINNNWEFFVGNVVERDHSENREICEGIILSLIFILFIIIFSRVRLSPLGTAVTIGLLYQPQMIDDGDCGAVGGMKIGWRNRSTRRKAVALPLCLPQILHYLARLEHGPPQWEAGNLILGLRVFKGVKWTNCLWLS
jgi:hypothetical protein